MSAEPSLHYVAFPTLHEKPLTVAARLRLPGETARKPGAVIILHGSAGPTGREGGYAKALNEAGFATLEPDQWTARGLAGGAQGRPGTVPETLPDLFGARRFLVSHGGIDAQRIGVMGFSFGGVAAMLAATRAYSERFEPGLPFGAFMPVYPVCWLYNNRPGYEFGDLVDAPLLIMTGALDEYDDDPKASETLIAALAPADRARIRLEVMEDAHHGFDMPGADSRSEDRAGHRGAGGLITMRYNPMAATRAHRLAADFFSRALG